MNGNSKNLLGAIFMYLIILALGAATALVVSLWLALFCTCISIFMNGVFMILTGDICGIVLLTIGLFLCIGLAYFSSKAIEKSLKKRGQ